MSRAVANTLLPAPRPASTIARPRPRELPVTNHTCAIHPPLSRHPPNILEKPIKLRIGCAMDIPKDLFSALLLRGAEKDRTHHGFNPGCHLLGGDTVGS